MLARERVWLVVESVTGDLWPMGTLTNGVSSLGNCLPHIWHTISAHTVPQPQQPQQREARSCTDDRVRQCMRAYHQAKGLTIAR